MLKEFLSGQPTIYDVGLFLTSGLALVILVGIHFRQIKHRKEIAELQEKVNGEQSRA